VGDVDLGSLDLHCGPSFRMNPMLAMATGKFKIEGSLLIAMKLPKIFKR
jgi:hypothetical protein